MRSQQQVAAVEITGLLQQWEKVVLSSWMQRELRFIQKHELLGLSIKDQQAQQVDQLLFSGRELVQ